MHLSTEKSEYKTLELWTTKSRGYEGLRKRKIPCRATRLRLILGASQGVPAVVRFSLTVGAVDRETVSK